MNWTFTEGAKRALLRAANLADGDDAGGVQPMHLLVAMVLDESRAAEILAKLGISRESIAAEAPAEGDRPQQRRDVSDVLAANFELQFIVREAGGRAGRSDPGGELNSAHLLWALTVVPSAAAEFLAERGVGREAFESPEPTYGEPLAVDFEIAWEDEAKPQAATPAAKPACGFAALRVIDAAANRAREGLRVIEDFARFELNDVHLTGALKDCRHELAAALTEVDTDSLTSLRDTPGDVGTAITTDSESRRETTRDVVRANFKRVQEAVRSLEEYGKTVSAEMGTRCEAVRYKLYTLEKAILNTAADRERMAHFRLYLLLTRELCRRDPEEVLREAIAGGVDSVQLREKSMPDRELLAWAKRVRDIIRVCRGRVAETTCNPGSPCGGDTPPAHANPQSAIRNPQLIVNDRPDVAVLCNADGVHVGQEELTVAECRRIVGPDKLVGVSTHNIEQARQAVLDGADYLGVGPVFPSGTKAFDEFPGLDFVRQVAAEISLPWFAIGGITAENIADVRAAGATRVAVSGAICGAETPDDIAADLRRQLADRGSM